MRSETCTTSGRPVRARRASVHAACVACLLARGPRDLVEVLLAERVEGGRERRRRRREHGRGWSQGGSKRRESEVGKQAGRGAWASRRACLLAQRVEGGRDPALVLPLLDVLRLVLVLRVRHARRDLSRHQRRVSVECGRRRSRCG
eukprot:scaffold25828_cov48-Phaeocystis_antarctica.AAC.1